VNNFKLAFTVVLLKVRKDVKLTTLGGRLFQATATRSLKSFYASRAGTDLQQFYMDYHVYGHFQGLSSENKHLGRYQIAIRTKLYTYGTSPDLMTSNVITTSCSLYSLNINKPNIMHSGVKTWQSKKR